MAVNVIKIQLDDNDSQRIANLENLLVKLNEKIDSPKNEDDRWIDINEVEKLIGFSQTTIKDKITAGLFPKPNMIFARNRWSYLEIRAWMNDQVQKR